MSYEEAQYCAIGKISDGSQHYVCTMIPANRQIQHVMIRTCKQRYIQNQDVINHAKLLLMTCKHRKEATIKLALYLVKNYRHYYKL